MAIALPAEKPPRVDRGGQVRRHPGRMRRHQKETIIWGGVFECRHLDGTVQRRRPAKGLERLILYRGQHRRVDRQAFLPRQAERQNGKNVVMAGNARALRDECGCRAFERGQGSQDSLADFGRRLGGQHAGQQRDEDASTHMAMVILVEMVRKTIAAAALMAAVLMIGCGTSTRSPDGGSVQQAETGVSASGYPAGEPKDSYSPALASSTESQYSREQAEKK
jgi:hypothetical protein